MIDRIPVISPANDLLTNVSFTVGAEVQFTECRNGDSFETAVASTSCRKELAHLHEVKKTDEDTLLGYEMLVD